jgi:hypothetical protein
MKVQMDTIEGSGTRGHSYGLTRINNQQQIQKKRNEGEITNRKNSTTSSNKQIQEGGS